MSLAGRPSARGERARRQGLRHRGVGLRRPCRCRPASRGGTGGGRTRPLPGRRRSPRGGRGNHGPGRRARRGLAGGRDGGMRGRLPRGGAQRLLPQRSLVPLPGQRGGCAHGGPGGGCLRASEALELVSRLGGVTHRVRTVPPAVATAGAAVVEAGSRLLRRQPPFCREQARALVHGHVYDGSRATRELGLVYTPVEDTLRRTIAWYREHGYVRT